MAQSPRIQPPGAAASLTPAASPAASSPAAAADLPAHRYSPALADQIERRWQDYWDRHATFSQPNPGQPGFDPARPKFYILDMFPYPSGAGLHVGHPVGYTATDIVARFFRMKGYNVLHPMGWDAFGLPAEQYAIQTGVHPAITTEKAIETFRRQLKRFGFSYDWSRELGTIDPDYYRWTQWIFLQAYNAWFDPWQCKARPIRELIQELSQGDLRVDPSGDLVHIGLAANLPGIAGEPVGARAWHQLSDLERRNLLDSQRLAYLGETTVNWCPALGTVLANDEVIDGLSERGGHPVLRKPLRQWMFRITAYADRLLNDLDPLDWPESTKTQQREWIGKSEGAEIDFPVHDTTDASLRVFTTRPDTLFGATYMVVAPEHPLVDLALRLKPSGCDCALLNQYVLDTRNRSEIDRQADSKDKTGAFTGLFAVNPANNLKIPIYCADYVLMSYGHGAIMAVPAHDERDFAFAKKFNLPIKDVVYPRTFAVMAFYSQHASPDEIDSGNWIHVLADMLGLATTANAEPPVFPAVLDAARSRRQDNPSPDLSTEIKVGVLTPRGDLQKDWRAAIQGLGFSSFSILKQRFDSASLFDTTGAPFTGLGYNANSANSQLSLNDLPTHDAKSRITCWLEHASLGSPKVNFKLRDWAFSRQRYWGEPFPIVYDDLGNHYPVSESALPVTLPELDDYAPHVSDDPMPLLAKARAWVKTTAARAGVDPALLPPDTPVKRETNTMPGSAGSSWYFLRYCDPLNSNHFIAPSADQYWMNVDLYVGGAEHAVGHLLYARFWQKILFDLGFVSSPEPFHKLFHQGLITAYSFQRADKRLVPNDQVQEVREGEFIETTTGDKLTPVVAKMSKSLKNVVNPDDIFAQYGADTFRLYEMYMGPLEASKPWNTKDTVGLFRLLQRIWRLAVDESSGALRLRDLPDPALERALHKLILKVESDIPRLAFNTAIGAVFEFVNAASSAAAAGPALTRSQLERFVLILAPFAPHISEEIWSRLGMPGSLAYHPFPVADPNLTTEDSVEIPIQINGKLRHKITVPTAADKTALEAAALADPKVLELLAGQKPKKIIAVPGKMINLVL